MLNSLADKKLSVPSVVVNLNKISTLTIVLVEILLEILLLLIIMYTYVFFQRNDKNNLLRTSSTPMPRTTTEDPCNYKPVKHSFRKPGRRISEASKIIFYLKGSNLFKICRICICTNTQFQNLDIKINR